MNVLSYSFVITFDTVYHNILIGKVIKPGLGEWTETWRETVGLKGLRSVAQGPARG